MVAAGVKVAMQRRAVHGGRSVQNAADLTSKIPQSCRYNRTHTCMQACRPAPPTHAPDTNVPGLCRPSGARHVTRFLCSWKVITGSMAAPGVPGAITRFRSYRLICSSTKAGQGTEQGEGQCTMGPGGASNGHTG
jgi:hypothetical protein